MGLFVAVICYEIMLEANKASGAENTSNIKAFQEIP